LVIPLIEYALRWTPAQWTLARAVTMNVMSVTPSNVVAYAVVALAWHAATYSSDLRERELRAAQLESELTRSRLQLLKSQLQPHFLFNTLNTVSGLMRDDVRGARVMLSRLAELLRTALDRFDAQEVPLSEELELVQQYLDIQAVRFGDRLTVRLDVDDAAADALVPSFLLQPVVENAIRHGVEAQTERGEIAIAARVGGTAERERLLIEVRDNGPGLRGGAPRGDRAGVGLENTRARLRQLYGDAQRLTLADAPGGGTSVVIELPLRVEAPDPVELPA
jgi:LytS/YehU family sensor histidine kinase